MVDRQSSPRGWWSRHVAVVAARRRTYTPIRARPIGANGLVSPIPASTAITDQPSRLDVVRLADVYPLVTTRTLARSFTYAVPDEIEKGDVVSVRLGRRTARGVVTEVDVVAPAGVVPIEVERRLG